MKSLIKLQLKTKDQIIFSVSSFFLLSCYSALKEIIGPFHLTKKFRNRGKWLVRKFPWKFFERFLKQLSFRNANHSSNATRNCLASSATHALSLENDVEKTRCKFRCTSNRKRKCYAQRNSDPKDCYCGEKECPVRAANRLRLVISLPTYGILRTFHVFWLQTDRN